MSNIFIDKLAFLYIQDSKLLVTLDYGKDTWYIPGGKRESGESDNQALIREVKEELSVELIPNTIRPYGIFEAQAHGKPEGTMVRMTCYTAAFSGALQPAAEISQMDYFTYQQKTKTTVVDNIIFEDLFKRGLIA